MYRMLPVNYYETSVKVKVQHDNDIHPGVCYPGCDLKVSIANNDL